MSDDVGAGRRLGLVAVTVLVLIAGIWFALRGAREDSTAEEPGERSGGVAEPTAAPSPGPSAAAPGEPGAPRPQPAVPTRPTGVEAGTVQPAAVQAGGGTGSGSAPAAAAGSLAQESQSPSNAVANKEDIRAAIRALIPEVRRCYEQGLKQRAGLSGTVRVEFTLAQAPDGGAYAKQGEIGDTTLAAPFVEACILTALQSAHFQDLKGSGEVRVRYPFKFDAEAGGFGGAEP